MAWDKDKPIDDEKLRLLAGVIRDNWAEIEQNDSGVLAGSLNQWAIHLIDRNEASVTGPATPVAIDEVGILYCRDDGLGGKRDLFYRNADADVQLTRNDKVSVASNGYTYLPGGLILQWWKTDSVGTGTQSITIPTAFPNSILNIQLTAQRTGVINDVDIYVRAGTETVSGFDVRNESSNTVNIYFMAIGT